MRRGSSRFIGLAQSAGAASRHFRTASAPILLVRIHELALEGNSGFWGERAPQYSSARMMVSTRVAFPVSIASLEAAMSRAKQSTSKM